MAQSNLAVLPSPHFPQITRLDNTLLQLESRVDRVLLAHNAPVLESCEYESPETFLGACDGLPCAATATVFDQESESEYCLRHFMEVSRG